MMRRSGVVVGVVTRVTVLGDGGEGSGLREHVMVRFFDRQLSRLNWSHLGDLQTKREGRRKPGCDM